MPELFEHPRGTSVGELEVDRILTVPNAITTVRALCIPLFVVLLFDGHRAWAGLLLGALGATDWVDGYVARRFHQTSTFGKMYDPTVDRLMLVTSIVAIMIELSFYRPFLVYSSIVLLREVTVAGFVVVITMMGAKRMDVTWWGKVATFANMCAFPWFLFAFEESWSEAVRDTWLVLAWGAAVPGVVFGLMAAWQYLGLGRRALAEGRAERAAAAAHAG